MRAAVIDRYGPPDVVEVADVPRPDAKAGRVVVRVVAVAVTSGDARIRGARFPAGFGVLSRLAFGIRRPRRRILGSAFSGVVTEVGPRVTGVAVGDEVCGMAGIGMGAHAEYVAVAARKVVAKPAGVSHEDAAGVLFGGTTALHFLRTVTEVEPGAEVLVVGASGAIGTNAVALAKHFGARVTAVTSAANAALVRGLGADRVVDYTTTDPAAITERFDVVLDAVGTFTPATGRHLLRADGVLLLIVASLGDNLRARGNVKAGVASERPSDFEYLLKLVADGELRVVVDSIGTLDEIVTAYRRVDSGHKVGNVVIRMA